MNKTDVAKNENARLDLSIIVISFHRGEELIDCLTDIAAQETDYAFEVVLILQGYPADFADNLCKRFSNALLLHSLEFGYGLGVHRARNEGLRIAKGEIIAFLDDDCRLGTCWVESLIPYYADPTLGGVGGFVRHPSLSNWWRKKIYPLLGLSSRRYQIDWGGFSSGPAVILPKTDQAADWLSGCNMSFRHSVLQRVGPFDVIYGQYGCDDVDIGLRVRQSGWRLVASPKLIVDHYLSSRQRQSWYIRVFEEETRRVLLVRRAIGHHPLWQIRYLARFSIHFCAMVLLGVSKRDVRIPISALRGAIEGLRRFAG